MVDDRRISPLAHRAPIKAPDGAASMAERPHLGKLILRADAKATGTAVKKHTGTNLPATPNTSSRSKKVLILWLGPDEWMLVTDPGAEHELCEQLTDALAETHHQLLDVTDQHTTIELGGQQVREMLMKLTTLDLHPRNFRAGDTAGSMFGRATATLCLAEDDSNGDALRFELIVQRSFADYMWCLLAQAGCEFGLTEQQPRAGEIMRP